MLHFKSVGEGKKYIVFLHGFMESLTMWEYLHEFPPTLPSIYFDLPGHGQSVLENIDNPSIGYLADECLKALKHLNIANYDIVGHSMGGYVALHMKENDPNCKKVILLHSNFWEDSPQKKADRIRVAELALKAKNVFVSEAIPGLFFRHSRQKKEVQELIAEAKNMSPEAIAYASLAMRNRRSKKKVIEQHPTDFLIIHGKHDPLIPVEKLQEELGQIGCKLVILPDAGHMSHIENPSLLRDVLHEFLN